MLGPLLAARAAAARRGGCAAPVGREGASIIIIIIIIILLLLLLLCAAPVGREGASSPTPTLPLLTSRLLHPRRSASRRTTPSGWTSACSARAARSGEMYALVILLSKAAPERTRGESGIRCIRTRSHPRGALKDTAQVQVPPSSRAEACVFLTQARPASWRCTRRCCSSHLYTRARATACDTLPK